MNFDKLYPSIDLHGEDFVSAGLKTKEFISDSVFLKRRTIIIIHGKGYGIVKNGVYNELKKNKNVESYHLNMNLGSTTVILKENK